MIGREGEHASSLSLAAFAAEALGNGDEAKVLRDAAAAAEAQASDPDVILRRDLANAVAAETIPPEVLARVEKAGDRELLATAKIMQALRATSDSLAARLQLLDEAAGLLDAPSHQRVHVETHGILCSAYAELYRSTGHYDEALGYYERVLSFNPRDYVARQNTAAILANMNRWPQLITFVQRQIEMFGEQPGLLLMLGKAQLRAGAINEAASTLYRAIRVQRDPQLKAVAEVEFHAAMDAGAKPSTPAPTRDRPAAAATKVTGGTTLNELEEQLTRFASSVKSERRMDFWKRDDKHHEWRERPELLAKGLLASFLKGCFGERMEGFEEVGAGAGRLDLYLRFEGGLAVIIELKMCGGRYSTTYALNGIGQLEHYMDNRRTGIGYLIVFDGRTRDFGTKVTPEEIAKAGVIRGLVVDVRPTVSGDASTIEAD